jgi:hypothetical protein
LEQGLAKASPQQFEGVVRELSEVAARKKDAAKDRT